MGSSTKPLEILAGRAYRAPDNPILVHNGERWGCGRLWDDSTRVAAAFDALGVRPGERVALHMPNIPEAMVAFCACLASGAVAVPLSVRMKPAELETVLRRVRPSLYLGQSELYETMAGLGDEVLAFVSRFVVGGYVNDDRVQDWHRLRELGSPVADALFEPWRERDLGAPAALLMTSGTTGSPKLTVWTHETLGAFVTGHPNERFRAGDVIPATTPLMHSSGLYKLACVLQQDTCLVLLSTFEPDAILDAIERERCTVLFGLPFACAALTRAQQERARDVSSLRLCYVAGDVCPPEIEARFLTVMGRPLVSLWAATEDGGAALPALRPGPLTRFKDDVIVRLIDPSGKTVSERLKGAVGELLIRSRTTSPGYWLAPDHLDGMPNGWFHTGDLMSREADGHLRYMGRTKDLIVSGGANISPVEVEEALLSHSQVSDAAVAGIDDAELGQRVGALLVLRTGPVTVAEIIDAVGLTLADYKVPQLVKVVAEVPRNAMTKIDRQAVSRILTGEAGNLSK